MPENVYLMTYEPWQNNSYLIRFEHILDQNEDPTLSAPVNVNLTAVFSSNFTFMEVTLAANQKIEDLQRLEFSHSGFAAKQLGNEAMQTEIVNGIITLKPMEIRTFIMSIPTSRGILSQTVFIYFPLIVIATILKNFM